MAALTQKQANVLAFIKGFIADVGISPTRQEIADNFDVWPNSVQAHIVALEKKGALDNIGKSRGLVPTKGFRVRVL